MVVLVLIGLLHANVWGGDILRLYAIIGLLLLALHKLSGKWLLGITLSLHVIGIVVNALSYDYLLGGHPNMPPLLNILQLIISLISPLIYFIEGFSLMQIDALKN